MTTMVFGSANAVSSWREWARGNGRLRNAFGDIVSEEDDLSEIRTILKLRGRMDRMIAHAETYTGLGTLIAAEQRVIADGGGAAEINQMLDESFRRKP